MRRDRRNLLVRLALITFIVVLGLGSRRFGRWLPGFVAAYAGDTLWALVAFLGIGLIRPRASTWRVAALALSFSLMVEISQLYHAPWIDSIRSTSLGALILGHGFLWSDLACYAVGVGFGVLVEETVLRGSFQGLHRPPRPSLVRGDDPSLPVQDRERRSESPRR